MRQNAIDRQGIFLILICCIYTVAVRQTDPGLQIQQQRLCQSPIRNNEKHTTHETGTSTNKTPSKTSTNKHSYTYLNTPTYTCADASGIRMGDARRS